MMQTPICCAKWAEKFHGDISNLAPLCPVFSQRVPPACSLGACYPKTLHLFVNYFLCISSTSGNLPSEFMTALVATVLSIFVIQKSA
jgi:hypothetical protein